MLVSIGGRLNLVNKGNLSFYEISNILGVKSNILKVDLKSFVLE